ncbi:prefoldin subunit 1 [Monosporozyma unispora]|nr:prefolding complex chaperone subunit [Kazachstania unispora]
MSAPDIFNEMTNSLRNSRTQLDVVNQQLMHLERQDKLAQVTEKELDSYPVENVWRSCGKAFILQDKSQYISDLREDETALKEQMENLKIKQNYLETSVEKTVANMKKVLEKSNVPK